jgi:hypothetical protein
VLFNAFREGLWNRTWPRASDHPGFRSGTDELRWSFNLGHVSTQAPHTSAPCRLGLGRTLTGSAESAVLVGTRRGPKQALTSSNHAPKARRRPVLAPILKHDAESGVAPACNEVLSQSTLGKAGCHRATRLGPWTSSDAGKNSCNSTFHLLTGFGCCYTAAAAQMGLQCGEKMCPLQAHWCLSRRDRC